MPERRLSDEEMRTLRAMMAEYRWDAERDLHRQASIKAWQAALALLFAAGLFVMQIITVVYLIRHG